MHNTISTNKQYNESTDTYHNAIPMTRQNDNPCRAKNEVPSISVIPMDVLAKGYHQLFNLAFKCNTQNMNMHKPIIRYIIAMNDHFNTRAFN